MSFELVGVQLVAQDAAQFNTAMATADKAVAGFGDQAGNTFKQMPGLSDIAVGALHKIGEVAVEAFAAAGKAAIGFVKDSVSVAGDFEAGMNRASIAIGDSLTGTGLKIDDFKKDFITLGKELPVSTADVQKSFIELVKGGVDPMTLHMGGLKSSVQFAAAAELDLTEAAQISARQLGVWTKAGASAEEQSKFLAMSQDILVKAANAGVVGVKDLAQGMNVAGGQAAALNVDYKDFATTMAEIAPAFNSTLEAGTGYKNFLARLQPTTKPAIAAMQALGLYTQKGGSAFFDATGKFVGNRKAADLLQKATAGLTDQQRAQLTQTIFGNDAMGVAIKLAADGGAGYDAMAAKIEKASGVQASAKTAQEGFNTALDNFHGSIEALQITIGSALLPVLTKLFNDYLAPGINTLTDLSAALSGDQDAFNKLPGPIQSVIGTVQGFFDLFSSGPAVAAINFFYKVFPPDVASTLTDGLLKVRDIFSGVMDVFSRGNDVLPTIINLLYKIFPPDIAGQISDGILAVRGAVTATFSDQGILGVIQLGIDKFAEISPAFAVIKGIAETVFPAVQKIVTDVFNIITGFIKEHSDKMLADVQSIWKQIWDVINAILPPIQKIISVVFGFISTFLEKNGADISAFLAKTWDQIYQVISTALALIKAILVPVFTFIGDFLARHGDTIMAVMKNTWDIIKAIIDAALTLIKGVITVALDIVTGKWSKAWTDLKAMSARIVEDLLQIISSGLDNLKKTFDTTIDLILGIWDGLVGKSAGIGNDIIHGIINGVKAAGDELMGVLRHLAEQALQSAKDALGIGSPSRLFAQEVGFPVAQGIAQGVNDGSPLVRSALMNSIANPALLMSAGNTNNTTNNNQRNVNLNYNTQYAPSPATSLAMANALAY